MAHTHTHPLEEPGFRQQNDVGSLGTQLLDQVHKLSHDEPLNHKTTGVYDHRRLQVSVVAYAGNDGYGY